MEWTQGPVLALEPLSTILPGNCRRRPMTYAEEMLQHKAVELAVLDQMPDTNALSPPGGTYCLPRMPMLSPTSTYATSYEYLLPTPASSTSQPTQKKHLRYYIVGCFTTAESLPGCHSLPKGWEQGLPRAQRRHRYGPCRYG